MEDLVYRHNAEEYNESENEFRPIRYRAQRKNAYIENPKEYYICIERFNVSTNSIPLIVWDMIINGLINESAARITISFNGTDYTGDAFGGDPFPNVVYFSDSNLPYPGSNNRTQRYFWSYSYHHIAEVLNAKFATIHAELENADPTVGSNPIVFVFDEDAERFRLRVPTAYTNHPTPPKVNVNAWLSKLFEAFPKKFVNDFSSGAQKLYELYYVDNGNNTETIGGVEYLVITGEHPNWVNIRSLKKLVFTSPLPVKKEAIQAGGAYSNEAIDIIFDLIPLFDTPGAQRGELSYFLSGPPRLNEMISTQSLDRLEFSLFWTDSDGELIPFELGPKDRYDVKFAFYKKGGIY